MRSGFGFVEVGGVSGNGHSELEAYDSRRGGVDMVQRWRSRQLLVAARLCSNGSKVPALAMRRLKRA